MKPMAPGARPRPLRWRLLHTLALTGLGTAQPAQAQPPSDGCPPPALLQQVATDTFHHGLGAWRLEAQDPRARVQAAQGVLDIETPAGLTLWWRQPLQGDYVLRFTATALPAPATAGPLAGRVSDLNMFWNASEPDGGEPRPRNGAFAAYDTLRLYYAGFGANGNTTTRLRHYNGQGARTLLDGWADPPEAEPADRQGAMTPATRLVPGRPMRVQIVSRRPTPADARHLIWSVNGRILFTRSDTSPLLHGWFGLRSTASRFQVQHFEILQCQPP